jgi:hypothetical protein
MLHELEVELQQNGHERGRGAGRGCFPSASLGAKSRHLILLSSGITTASISNRCEVLMFEHGKQISKGE